MNSIPRKMAFVSAVGALCLLSSGVSADTVLRVSHMWPAESEISKEVFEAWAQRVEEDSQGTLRIQLFPAGTLTRSDQAYQGAVNGVSDIAITAQSYTAGRFPLTQIVELPGLVTSAEEGSCILQTLYDDGHISGEYEDSHVLFMFTRGPGILHLRNAEVSEADGLAGLRIRRPSAVVGNILEKFRAQPVGIPMPDVYTSIQRGVMDGAITSYQGAYTFGLNDIVTSHTQVPLETLSFVATMNSRSYDQLPDVAKQALDQNSGMEWSHNAATVFDKVDREGREDAVARGNAIHVVEDPLNDEGWGPFLREGIEEYLLSLEARGLDASSVYSYAQDAKAACGS